MRVRACGPWAPATCASLRPSRACSARRFLPTEAPERDVDPAKAGPGGLNPFQLLSAALDRMVEAGALPPARRAGAEFLAWSAVHGLALLIIDGPLRGLDEAQAHAAGQRLLDMVEKGL